MIVSFDTKRGRESMAISNVFTTFFDATSKMMQFVSLSHSIILVESGDQQWFPIDNIDNSWARKVHISLTKAELTRKNQLELSMMINNILI